MNMKKFALALGGALASVASFAEETGGSADTSLVPVADVSGIFTQAQTAMGSLLDAALPVVIAFVVGGLTIWGALALVSLIKRGFGAGKGR